MYDFYNAFVFKLRGGYLCTYFCLASHSLDLSVVEITIPDFQNGWKLHFCSWLVVSFYYVYFWYVRSFKNRLDFFNSFSLSRNLASNLNWSYCWHFFERQPVRSKQWRGVFLMLYDEIVIFCTVRLLKIPFLVKLRWHLRFALLFFAFLLIFVFNF